MKLNHIFICLLLFSNSSAKLFAQAGNRKYKQSSVLAAGNTYKIAVGKPGIYKIDISLLQRMGIGSNLPVNTIHLYGSGGRMLGEATSSYYTDDLPEIALWAAEGGDGILNDNDYLLFYAPGPHTWKQDDKDNFYHQHHLYSDSSFYFLSIGGPDGLRIQQQQNIPAAQITETAFDYHQYYEKDSINFLGSGKQWWGDMFSNVVGLSKTYNFRLPGNPIGAVKVKMSVAGKSSGGCNFNVTINQTAAISNLYLLPVTDNVFEGVASTASGEGAANVSSSALNIRVGLAPDNINDKGWLDYLEVQARVPLILPAGEALDFRSRQTAAGIRFALANATAQTQIWEVTDLRKPVAMKLSSNKDSVYFSNQGDILREYLAFRPSDIMQPVYKGIVPAQDLHGQQAADLLIITAPVFKAQAERLASFHREKDGLSVNVATTEQVYNEFGSGTPDPVAIRDYVKRFADQKHTPSYLLLFGAASYDYRNRVKNNTNLVPSWQSTASLDAIKSYVSDDFFGILKDGADINRLEKADLLETGIGRIPATNLSEATTAVDKIISYRNRKAFGRWRNEVMLIADDEDHNLHFNDAEQAADVIQQASPQWHLNKIYVDGYPQVTDANGASSPAVNQAINNGINQGALIVNYTGHGSSARLAAENIIDAGSLDSWNNTWRLPLFITATCDFAPFDDPGITSLGHKILFKQNGGSIALMTTTRAVVAASNRVLNDNYFESAFQRREDGQMPSLGTAAMLAKNKTYNESTDYINNRKFQLLGDPALTLAYPAYRVVTDSVNGAAGLDSLKALGSYEVKGHIETGAGVKAGDFNGTLYTIIYDQPSVEQTRGNDAGSLPAEWHQQKNILFKGSQTITNGNFSFTFVAPKDIRTGSGTGKISYYATNEQTDGAGYNGDFATGGVAANVPTDITGPVILAWIDNRRFRNNDIVGPSPLLIIDLTDTSGINISGNDPEHSITAILDGTDNIVLNDYFEADLDNFRKGSIQYPLSRLSAGVHNITIQAWDNYNNKTATTIQFTVSEEGVLAVEEVRNYPNPVWESTRFTFSHNQQNEELEVTLQIFTIDGRVVKTMRDTIISTNGRYDGMPWDGRGDSGARLLPGLYVYRLAIKTRKGTKVKGGKLVLL